MKKEAINLFIVKYLGTGLHYCGFGNGWITIDKVKNNWSILWCSDKYTHTRVINPPAVSIHFDSKGEIQFICKSIINMHEVIKDKDKNECTNFILNKVRNAYKHRKFVNKFKSFLSRLSFRGV